MSKVWLLFLIGALFPCLSRAEDKTGSQTTPPRAVEGVLDLSSIDLSKAGMVPLRGEWEFYWDTWIDPVHPPVPPSRRVHVLVPSNWKTYATLEPPPTLYGKATYRLRVITDGKSVLYGLRLKRIYSAYRLYVNGVLIVSNGTLKENLAETEGQLAVRTVYFTSFSPSIDIVLHVANPYYYRAGILSPPELGTQQNVERAHVFALAMDVFLLGVIAIMAAYYFILSLTLVKHRYSSLFFALFCTVVGLRVLLISGERFLYYLIPELSLRFDMALQGFGIYLLIPTFLAFVYFLFPARANPVHIKWIAGASLLYLIATLILSPYFHGYILTSYYPFFIGGLLYMVWIIGYALYKKDEDSLLEGVGFLFILLSASYDMLVDREVYHGEYILPLGLLGFIFIQSVILSNRFSRTFLRLESVVTENKRILDALETRVEERTAALRQVNESLEEARKLAEEASMAKTRFLQNMSHEMRTPLNGILGYAELIRDTDPTSNHQSYAQKIIEESKNLVDLINQILDLSKIEAGRLTLEQIPFNLSDLVHSVHEILLPLAEKKRIEYRLSLVPPLPSYLKGDPLRLRQVLVNLVGNAIKFTHEGWVELKVERVEASSDREVLLFTVRDTGIGISKQFQPSLFDSFTQAQEGLSKSYGGTGLGTSIAKQLVESMGGSISFQSEERRGTTFWVSIPFRAVSGQESPSRKVAKEDTPFPSLEGKTVLVVEDYPTTLLITRQHLESAGATVLAAENGMAGVRALGKRPVDCILMDVQMPQMDGLETTRLIRKLPQGKTVPILGMTASAYNEDIQSCLEAGMNDVLTKPLRKKDLLEKISQWTSDPTHGTFNVGQGPEARERESPESSSHPVPPLDMSRLQEEWGGEAEELGETLSGFLSQMEELILKIEGALEKADLESLARHAHKLKGGALTIYAAPLAKQAEALIKRVRAGASSEEIVEAWAAVQKEAQALAETIKTIGRR